MCRVIKYIMVFLPVFSGCITPFDFKSEELEHVLFINGYISQNPGPYDVYIGYSTDYNSNHQITESNAGVFLYEDNNLKEQLKFDPSTGSYRGYGQGCIGSSYSLEVIMPDGTEYKSFPEIMPGEFKPDSVIFNPTRIQEMNEFGSIVRAKVIDVYIRSDVKRIKQNFWLRWNVETVYSIIELSSNECNRFESPRTCYISEILNPNDFVLFDSRTNNTESLDSLWIAEKKFFPWYQYRNGQYFNVAQISMTSASYDYWKKIRAVVNPTGSIFDPPPAPVQGNIYNTADESELVLGYFEAITVDTIRAYLSYSNIPWIEKSYPYCGVFISKEYCCDCIRIPNSTYDRPYYWDK